MKHLILSLFLLCSIFIWANTEFIVHCYDGTQTTYSVSDRGGLYFENGNLLVNQAYGSQIIEPIANIRKITIQNFPVGNDNVTGDGGKGISADGDISIGREGANNSAMQLTVSTSGTLRLLYIYSIVNIIFFYDFYNDIFLVFSLLF